MQLKTLLDQLRVDLVWKGVWAMKFFNEEGYRSFVTKYQECLFENTYGVEFNDANKVKVYGKEFIGWANPDKADDSVWEDAKDSFVKSPNLATPVRETHDLREEFEEAANEGNIRMLEKQIPAIRSHIKGRINKEFRDWLVDIRILFVVEVLMNLSCIFKDLVPESILPDEFLCAIKYSDYNSATTKINLAVDHLPQFKCCKLGHPDSGPQHVGTIHIGSESMEDIDFACQEVVNGSPSRRPIIEMTIPSVLDKTISPPGIICAKMFHPDR